MNNRKEFEIRLQGGSDIMRNRIFAGCFAIWLITALLMLMPCTALAYAAPEAIILSDAELIIDLAKGKEAPLSASVYPSNADQDVNWKTADLSIAYFNRGKMYARKIGVVTVTASSAADSTVRAICTVRIIDSRIPETIELNQTTVRLDLAKSETLDLDSAAYPAAADQSVEWKTSSSSIVRVSSSGVLSPRKFGTTTIMAVSKRSS